ncbi:MAG: 3-dehydroquinate synthase [Anaerolineaceae bacterium]
MSNRHIYLYGPPGSGKSRIGVQLAEQLSRPFVDIDLEIEKQIDTSISDFFRQKGETDFRNIELEVLGRISSNPKGQVIALGGGALLGQENQKIVLQTGEVVCLMADFNTLLKHIESESEKRPLLQGILPERLNELLKERASHYQQFPTLYLDGLSEDQIVNNIQIHLGQFFISGMGSGYPVNVQKGLINQAGDYFQQMGLKGPVAIVTDQNVGRYYLNSTKESLNRAGYQVTEVIVPAGEQHKTIHTVMQLWDNFLEAGLERGSTVLALGGGVLTDMAGFAASTFLRGVAWVACPTSLLGMVDASLGGKTGVDLAQGKNLVGSFYPPKMVLTDPGCLASLPIVELRNGMAEVLKHGIISSPEIVKSCLSKNWKEDLANLIPLAMSSKIQVLRQDPYEKGRRAVLNLGHTIGHAIELVSDFKMRHGEAIGLGMLLEARISYETGLCDSSLPETIKHALLNIHLPSVLPETLAIDAILAVMQRDKKRADGKVKFALPHQIGEVSFGNEVSLELVREILESS